MPESGDAEGVAEDGESDPFEVLQKFQSENEDLKDELLRSAAELQNLRRRAERERQEASQYAAASFARDIITVADNLSRALEVIPTETRENLDEAATRLHEIEVQFGTDLGDLRNLSDTISGNGTNRRTLEETTRELQAGELELEKRRGDLLPLEEVEAKWTGIASTIRERALALPDKLAPQVSAVTDDREVRELLRAEVRSWLMELSDEVSRVA